MISIFCLIKKDWIDNFWQKFTSLEKTPGFILRKFNAKHNVLYHNNYNIRKTQYDLYFKV